ncbi:MAG: hypothetical protein J0H67_18380 [Rhodospirillales bacterium]|nr:hypothetical protein [Rhodospirillales bacterium]
MSHSLTMPRSPSRGLGSSFVSIDTVIAALFILVYAIVVHWHEYHGAFAESDLYRMLVGLLDGAVSGKGIASPLHYDRDFGFGYLGALYAFASPAVLRDPDRLTQLMNQIGFWSMLPGLVFFWVALRLVHGARIATVALIIMALGPMNPEMFTSGHPTIPMFALLGAAAVLLFLPVRGWAAVIAAFGGFLLLLTGMTVRGEIFLAFPWLVLARADTSTLRKFLLSCVLRSIAPLAAIIVFLLAQKYVQALTHSDLGATVSTYFLESYTWVTIKPGLVYLALGCGILTTLAAGVALAWYCARNLLRRTAAAEWLSELLGPLALILVPLAFFLPNPVPTRHYFLVLAGMAIVTAIALVRGMRAGSLLACCIALALGTGDQVASELVRPTLVRINEAHSPYIPVPEAYPTATHANLGWEWRRHEALLQRREEWNAFGAKLLTSCDTHVIVVSDEMEQIFSRLYQNGAAVTAHRVTIPVNAAKPAVGSDDPDALHMIMVGAGELRLPGFMGVRDGRTFIMVEEAHAWPADPIATILADPAYDAYHVVADPYTVSKFDRTPIPPDRQVRFGCASSGGS